MRRLQAALARLPVTYREVLVLRELEDLPYRDIAAVVDVPVGTVMSRLARAAAARAPADGRWHARSHQCHADPASGAASAKEHHDDL